MELFFYQNREFSPVPNHVVPGLFFSARKLCWRPKAHHVPSLPLQACAETTQNKNFTESSDESFTAFQSASAASQAAQEPSTCVRCVDEANVVVTFNSDAV